MPLQTLEPKRLYRQIADQLSALIAKGEFAAGARLPAERDLAKLLGVSRPSVREALIALEVEGWVEVRTGSGVYVLDRTQHAPVPQASTEWGPLELIRARRVVEGETAAIAAATSKRKDIEAMTRAIEHMRDLAERNVMPLEGDRAFHLAIVECCGNVVLSETVQGFWDSRRGPIFTRLGGYFESVKSWRSAIAEHEAIRDAIAARDAEGARRAMHVHMDKSHQRFSASWRRANLFFQPPMETRK
ncbi:MULTISPECIES: FadR/GntR family transcriptional regulator [unclassified Variovorax]|uniref:FadR/GntR family transcriptional regulator n=1 Tax=unclassified Variovorax TaxID=663243 RepID=UPI00076CA595|nr:MULTISPECIES: FadR/GntR family transcriptional regulator [unclassified Variovorax]KWT82755.1 Hexuronate utilization operon transcriptional repressor ExuR [Variovorax sp. WDL1]PNG59555.1 putative L-lactate dehydrogenase operon regulatory protein [Variovorax sp. B4]PNG60654.1 putative L-lactate dehydrogenase operon regulatory protein [Variovorax sp. B2]VTV13449.1 Putative L-lactate dehydrogenase operon regulatory protein [Variovorax sp. WDL1]